MPSQALTRLGGAGLRRGATRTRSQASTVAAHDGGHLGRCQLPLATDLGASVPSQSGGDGRRVTKDGEAPGGRPRGAGEPSQQLLGQEGGASVPGGSWTPTRRAPCWPRQSPGTPAPALHAQPPCTQIRDEGLRETGPSVAPLPPSRPDSPLCWAPPRPGRPGPCCQGGARRRASRRCRAAPPGAGAAPLPDPRHNRTPAGSRTTHLQV